MIRNFICTLLMLSFLTHCQAQKGDFDQFMETFIQSFKQLELPEFQIDYKSNLESIQPLDSVLHQEEVIMDLVYKIRNIDRYVLSKQDRISFELMRYEINLNLERISLEKKWWAELPDSIPSNGVHDLAIGKDWYRYLLHHWVDRSVEPEQLFAFGKSEVERVSNEIDAIKVKSGLSDLAFSQHINAPSFYYHSPEEVHAAFEAKKADMTASLAKYFPFTESLPDHSIKRFNESTEIQTPAFYRKNEKAFYYNYFDKPFNKRQITWIYIHEANPGHHYQIQLTNSLDRSPIQEMFNYSGYREGWAAYVEEIGFEIGAYDDIYDALGKWEWDLIRSVRVVLDIGMNYYGWDDDEAMNYWREHIKDQDDIARREIKRMRNWPAQVITYKFGADKILRWKEIFERKGNFDLKSFHKMILENGDVPFSVLEPFILNEGVEVSNNILYVDKDKVQEDSLQRLNLLVPKDVVNPPLFLWIGSGAWAIVDRHREMNFARRIAQEGIAVASVGHRLSSAVFYDTTRTTGVKHPEHMKDIADAFRWLYDHADEYGYNKEKIFVGGYSSGAHLAALLSMDNRYLENVGLDKSDIEGVIPIGGTYDILDYKNAFATGSRPELVEEHVHAVFGDTKAQHLDASPTTYVSEMSVPMLLISDANMIGYTNVFEEKILETDFEKIDFYYVRNLSHQDLNQDLANNDRSKYRDVIVDFIR